MADSRAEGSLPSGSITAPSSANLPLTGESQMLYLFLVHRPLEHLCYIAVVMPARRSRRFPYYYSIANGRPKR